jgi:hypothetical protein
MVEVVWKSSWSYRSVVHRNEKDINGSFWFQIAVLACVVTVWIFSVIKSIEGDRRSDHIISYLMKEDCTVAKRSIPNQDPIGWLFSPRVILTRTTASLIIAVATAELLVFNAIANYSGSGSTNASSSLLILMVALFFSFFTLTHKYLKSSESDTRDKLFWISSGLMLLMSVGVSVGFLSYSDTLRWKDEQGRSMLFFVGALVVCFSALGLCILPLTKSMRPFRVEKEGTLSLILSGEYYTSFSFLDCLVVWGVVTNFLCMEAYFISSVKTQHYALPFVFLQLLPTYGFGTCVIGFMRSGEFLPMAFNAVLFVVMSTCVTTSMLHVCAIPGVRTACAFSLSHTTLNTNLVVCGPFLLLLCMTSVGLLNSTFTPSFLIRQDCIVKQRKN